MTQQDEAQPGSYITPCSPPEQKRRSRITLNVLQKASDVCPTPWLLPDSSSARTLSFSLLLLPTHCSLLCFLITLWEHGNTPLSSPAAHHMHKV